MLNTSKAKEKISFKELDPVPTFIYALNEYNQDFSMRFFRVPSTASWRLKHLPIRNLSTIINVHLLIWLASRLTKRMPKALEWISIYQPCFQRKLETPYFRSLCVENEAFLGTSSNTKRIYLVLRIHHRPCDENSH